MPRARLGLLLALALSACGHSAEAPPSLLLLTLDTTNPEALGCYGGPRGLTPNLDRLAREGVLFEDARTVAPLTLPAHASLLTGLYPVRHTLRRNGETRLASEARTLAELAQEHGYLSAAFVAAVVLAPEFGLDQGFAHYDAPPTPENVEEHLLASRGADEIVARAVSWLDQHEPAQPFFLWLHLYDPHFPHDPAPEFLARAQGDPYLGEVAAMDAAIGTLLERLERDGRLANTLVVAAADHGEGRGRHGEETHGAFVFDSTLRIPLLARLPLCARAGERVRAPVSQVDV
ncbi:MAG: sulfatase, partial [Planctomycetes bacterium]|nr:sulfatase [Planctomycetota bacterium]